MANRRSIKRLINLICEELFAEAVAASLYGNQPDNDNAEAIVSSIVRLHNNYISRISHPEPGMKAKQYYKDLCEKFSIEVDEIADQINNM